MLTALFCCICSAVPTAPTHLNVCSVYDMVDGTLQIIESNWNEVVCFACGECLCCVLRTSLLERSELLDASTYSSSTYSLHLKQDILVHIFFPIWLHMFTAPLRHKLEGFFKESES